MITLDRILSARHCEEQSDEAISLIEKIIEHKNIKEQIKEWQELGIVDENFKIEDIFDNSPSVKGWQAKPDGVVSDTPLQEGNYEVEFEDGTKINTKDLDYKLIKPLIWWE